LAVSGTSAISNVGLVPSTYVRFLPASNFGGFSGGFGGSSGGGRPRAAIECYLMRSAPLWSTAWRQRFAASDDETMANAKNAVVSVLDLREQVGRH